MKILEVKSLEIPDIKIIRFQRFTDERGYFTEIWRKTDFETHPETSQFMKGVEWGQANESFSKKGTVRGMHFQWNPYMSKLVRVVEGTMIDAMIDIRKGSPTYGKALAYDLTSNNSMDYQEWIWVPAGFAHGGFFATDGRLEYYCTGQWSPDCERGISPLAPDIDWSLCNPELKKRIDELLQNKPLMTDKDKNGLTVSQWTQDPNAGVFAYRS